MEISIGFEIGVAPYFSANALPECDFVTDFHVEWCSFPDLLMSPDRTFVGLSFPVYFGREQFSRQLAALVASPFVRHVPLDSAMGRARYEDHGGLDRLEVIWDGLSGAIECEIASAIEGYWAFPKHGTQALYDGFPVPIGYALHDLEEFLSIREMGLPERAIVEHQLRACR